MGIESKYIWMNGELVEYEKATLHFLTPALHYGAAVFEGIRCYDTEKGPAVFRLTDHMVRLINSAKIFGFRDLPYTVEDLVAATKLVVRENGLREAYIRPLIYLATKALGLNMSQGIAHVGIAAFEWGNYLGESALESGIRANVSSFTRHHINVTMTKAKIAGSYANSMMAKTDSVRLGFDETIMLDPSGYVAECSGENLFMVRDGKIFTSHTAGILEGITRDSIAAIASDLGYEVHETPISRDQLYIADELFVCGTAAEVISIRELDFRPIGNGKRGPIARALQEAYHNAIRGKHPRSAGWLDYI